LLVGLGVVALIVGLELFLLHLKHDNLHIVLHLLDDLLQLQVLGLKFFQLDLFVKELPCMSKTVLCSNLHARQRRGLSDWDGALHHCL